MRLLSSIDNAGRLLAARRRRKRDLASVLLLTLVLLALGACGGSKSNASSAAATTSPASTTASSAAGATPTASSTLPPVPTTPVPAPSSGNVTQTVPSGTLTTLPAAPITAKVDFGNKVTVKLVKIVAMHATARLPGEVAGPAAAVTIQIVNGSAKAISLTGVVIDLQDAAGTPGNQVSTSPSVPFGGTLAPGKSAVATYVFTIAANHKNPVSIAVSYTTTAPVVRFVGTVAS